MYTVQNWNDRNTVCMFCTSTCFIVHLDFAVKCDVSDCKYKTSSGVIN